jgi:HEAT repeat protein
MRWPVLVAAIMAILSRAALAEDDAHDKLVYGRYVRTLQPSRVKVLVTRTTNDMKTTQLDRPATRKDVEAGRAIFTFEGLGETRIWNLPEPSLNAEWPALSTPHSVGSGWVCQAEELNVGGKWKRYFGFVCERGAAVVPASQIELTPFAWPWIPKGAFFSKISWDITVPGPKPGFWKRQEDETVKVGDPLPVAFSAFNVEDHSQEIPATLYKDAQHGGPSLVDQVTISLKWAPFDAACPMQRPFVELEPIRKAHFPLDRACLLTLADRMHRPANQRKLFSLDLRDWFKANREGRYLLELTVDCKAFGLHDEFENLHDKLSVSRVFVIGHPPRLPTIEEYDRVKPALGGSANEERLRKSIHATAAQRSARTTSERRAADALVPWSQPAGGLMARIELFTETYCGFTVLVRLKNVSDKQFTVPMGNPLDPARPRSFELYTQRAGEPWQLADWFASEQTVKTLADQRRYHEERFEDRLATSNRKDREPVVLKPGETCLAYLCGNAYAGSGPRRVQMAEKIKVILRRPKGENGSNWTGVLETPPCPAHEARRSEAMLFATQPMPDYFPAMTYTRGHLMNEPSLPDVHKLGVSNGDLLEVLQLYEAPGVAVEFEKRMLAEKDSSMKLLLAALAAVHGSEKAALFLLERLKDTDCEKLNDTYHAITSVLFYYHDHLPAWVEDLLLACLSDERFVTGEESGNSMEIRQMADWTGGFSAVLGQFKVRKAVPVLIEIAKRDPRSSAIGALGEIGDPRAIPVILERLQDEGKKLKGAERSSFYDGIDRPVYALENLHAKEAVPVLLDYLEFPEVIKVLETIGDPRALDDLRAIVAAKGNGSRKGWPISPELAQNRLFAARLAILTLEKRDPVPQLCEMVHDASLDKFQRREAVWRLGWRQDARAIPHLVRAARTDASGVVVNQVIVVLGSFRYRAAVEGLIECFDLDFAGKSDWKRAYTPEMFREHIAESLRAITGQTFGPDKQQWLMWWQANGKQITELK